MNREESMNIEELEQAIRQWESAVEWIARGWDSIEDYTHDLQYREDLEEALSCYFRERLFQNRCFAGLPRPMIHFERLRLPLACVFGIVGHSSGITRMDMLNSCLNPTIRRHIGIIIVGSQIVHTHGESTTVLAINERSTVSTLKT